MKLCELIFENEYISSDADMSSEISHIAHSPDDVTENTLLVIPNSKKIQSLDFDIPPIAILCGSDAVLAFDCPIIKAQNIREATALIYSRFEKIDYSRIKFIGVTGTNGKSSTAMLIEKILSDNGHRVGFIGTGKITSAGKQLSDDYYSMTTPDPWVLYKTIANMERDGCDTVVMEASSHALSLDKLAPISFEIGVFTNLSPEHTDFHPNMENYFYTKCRLFKKSKTAVFNIDDQYARRAAREHGGKRITAGILWHGDVRATDIDDRGLDGSSYIYHGENFMFRMRLALAGCYNIYNSLLAAAACIEMGVKPCRVKESIAAVRALPGRFEIIKDDITVIIDYAHTDTAFENILKNLYRLKRPGNTLTVVFGCGGERDKAKRPRMAKIAESYADKIVLTSDNCRSEEPMDIISDIIHGFSKASFEVTEDRAEAIRSAIISAEDGDIVAVIGKGAECYNIDKNGYHPFDEQGIIKEALAERRERVKCE